MADDEVWRPVVGYEGFYEVSNQGRVRSVFRNKRLIKSFVNAKTGYVSVCLSRNGKKKMLLVHRLVAMAFLPNANFCPQVNHKDENKQNNIVSNLEWCTAKYNNNYGTIKERISIRNKVSKCKPVVQMLNGVVINKFPSTLSAKHIADPGHIGACCNGKRKNAGGYQWAFV